MSYEESTPEARREAPSQHRCRCLVLPHNRCSVMVPLDQPVCDGCEINHFGEHRVEVGTLVPLPWERR